MRISFVVPANAGIHCAAAAGLVRNGTVFGPVTGVLIGLGTPPEPQMWICLQHSAMLLLGA